MFSNIEMSRDSPGLEGLSAKHHILCIDKECIWQFKANYEAYYLSAPLFPNSSYAIMKAARSNMLAAGISSNKVKYSRLAADDDGYIDLQVRDLCHAPLWIVHKLVIGKSFYTAGN